MKQTQRKDAVRNILTQRVSWLSIILISFLGVTSFLGTAYSSAALKYNANLAYEQANFRDMEVLSSVLLTEEDLEAIRNTEGVADAEPVWQVNARAEADGQMKSVSLISRTERINLPETVEGRLPETAEECAVEARLAEECGWSPGDTITVHLDDDTGLADLLFPQRSFTITGLVNHPDHSCLNVPDTLYILVPAAVFDLMAQAGCFMKAEVCFEKAPGTDRFGEAYEAAAAPVYGRLEELGGERAGGLYDWMVSQYAAGKFSVNPVRKPSFSEIQKLRSVVQSNRWFVLNCRGNSSFVQVTIGSGNLARMETTFSLLFILVGAMVIYAAVSKMVDEQRKLVGTEKALGFRTREIFAKYLFFGISAVLPGALLGVAASGFLMQPFVLKNYGIYYTFSTGKNLILARETLIVLGAGILLAFFAVWFACARLLREPAVILMQPRVPGGRKKQDRSGKHRLSLYSRLILRNMWTDRIRVLVTIVSIAGCCALVVIGFTLRSAVNGAIRNEYPGIVDFDWKVRFDPGDPESAGRLDALFEEAGAEYVQLSDSFMVYRVTDIQTGELFVGDLEQIDRMYHMKDWKSREPLTFTDEGIYIQNRVAEIFGLKVGDLLEIRIGGTDTAEVPVAGIYNNYIGRAMLLGSACYERLFDAPAVPDTFFVRLGGADGEQLAGKLRDIPGFLSMQSADADREMFNSAASVLNLVVALLIFLAALMAGVVLLNLTNIYILQKKRELSVMRINGFTVGETIGYVLRETVVTTVLGILSGIALGSFIARRIILSLEQPFIQFERGVSIPAWMIGAMVTVFFTVLINLFVLRKVKHLSLTDAAA